MYDENIPFTKKICFAKFGKNTTPVTFRDRVLNKNNVNKEGDMDFTCGSEQFMLGSAGDTTTTLAIAFTRDYSVPAKRRFILDICCDGYIIEK
jgi:hypothetical protein